MIRYDEKFAAVAPTYRVLVRSGKKLDPAKRISNIDHYIVLKAPSWQVCGGPGVYAGTILQSS